jgi:hypothetical protein
MHGSDAQARSKLALRPRLFCECLPVSYREDAAAGWHGPAHARRWVSRRTRSNNAAGDRLTPPSGLHGRPLAVEDGLPGTFIMSLGENFIKTTIVSYRETIHDFLETSGRPVAECR